VTGQERAPSFERCEPLSDHIVHLLIDGRWRGWWSAPDGDDLRVPVGRHGNEVFEAKRPEDDAAGPVIVGVHVDYTDSPKLFEMVKGDSLL
jgi:hypothetical protein